MPTQCSPSDTEEVVDFNELSNEASQLAPTRSPDAAVEVLQELEKLCSQLQSERPGFGPKHPLSGF